MRIQTASSLSFPDSSVGKESVCSAGDPGSIPGLVRSPGEGKGYPLQYSSLEHSLVSQRVRHNWVTFTFHFHLWAVSTNQLSVFKIVQISLTHTLLSETLSPICTSCSLFSFKYSLSCHVCGKAFLDHSIYPACLLVVVFRLFIFSVIIDRTGF